MILWFADCHFGLVVCCGDSRFIDLRFALGWFWLWVGLFDLWGVDLTFGVLLFRFDCYGVWLCLRCCVVLCLLGSPVWLCLFVIGCTVLFVFLVSLILVV